MRRVFTAAAAAVVSGSLMLLAAVPANASIGWHIKEIKGVEARGTLYASTYQGRPTKAVHAFVRDNAKDGLLPAIEIAWKMRDFKPDYRYVWNTHGYNTVAESTVQSYNLDHAWIRTCVGRADTAFHPSRCGTWHMYY